MTDVAAGFVVDIFRLLLDPWSPKLVDFADLDRIASSASPVEKVHDLI